MHKTMAKLLGALALFASAAAYALPTTYTYSVGGVSGALNGVAFGPAALSIVVRGDSDAVSNRAFVYDTGPCITGTTTTLSINGAAPASFTTPMTLCVSSAGMFAGIYGPGGEDLLHFDGVLAGLDLKTPVGPLTMTGSQIHTLNGSPHGTSLGPFAITNIVSPPVAASLTVSRAPAPAPASIPTLSEWGLIGLSSLLAMFGFTRMRRKG